MNSAWLFPGQGSQFRGIGSELCRADDIETRVFGIAEEMSGLDLRRLACDGDAEALRDCRVLEPLLAAFALCDIERLRARGAQPLAVAGYSAGELAALYAADVLSLESTLRIAVGRGAVLHRAARDCPGRMSAIVGLPARAVMALLTDQPGAHLAGWNAPDHVTVAGEVGAVAAVEARARAAGAVAMSIDIEAPWHSPLANEAAEGVRRLIENEPFRPARVPVYSATTTRSEVRPEALRHSLWTQVALPVCWEAALRNLIAEQGIRRLRGLGACRGLAAMVRRVVGAVGTETDFRLFFSPFKETAHA